MTNPFEEAIKADKAAEKRRKQDEKDKRAHYVTIYVRGCDTTRTCYCLNSNGFDHDEYESPWVVDMEGNFERRTGKEVPLEIPFRDKDESLSEYRQRMICAKVWDECFEWAEPLFAMPHPNHNPYL